MKPSSLAAAFLIVLRRSLLLILFPYRTMRSITLKSDRLQVIIIFCMSLFYFLISHSYRHAPLRGIIAFMVFVTLFFLTVIFFYALSHRTHLSFSGFVYSFSYTLVPTLFWFYSTFVLFVLLPPPRTHTMLGTGFSIFFVAYSLSLLAWKFILVYLAVRFSSRQGLYRILYMLFLYLIIVLPVSVFFYYHRLFRIPFI